MVPEFEINAVLAAAAFVRNPPATDATATCDHPSHQFKSRWMPRTGRTAPASGNNAAPAVAATTPIAMAKMAMVAADLSIEYRDLLVSSSSTAYPVGT